MCKYVICFGLSFVSNNLNASFSSISSSCQSLLDMIEVNSSTSPKNLT